MTCFSFWGPSFRVQVTVQIFDSRKNNDVQAKRVPTVYRRWVSGSLQNTALFFIISCNVNYYVRQYNVEAPFSMISEFSQRPRKCFFFCPVADERWRGVAGDQCEVYCIGPGSFPVQCSLHPGRRTWWYAQTDVLACGPLCFVFYK